MLSRSQDGALLLGRLFVAALFLPSGFNKLMTFSAFSASLAAKGMPYPTVAAGLTGGGRASRPIGSHHRLVAALDCPGADRLHCRYTLDDTRPIRDRAGVPPPAERRFLPEPRHHWRVVVLLCQWTGRLEQDQPPMRGMSAARRLPLPQLIVCQTGYRSDSCLSPVPGCL